MITEKISSVKQLLEVLPECSGTDYVDIVKDMHIDPKELEPFAFWADDFYTRNCLGRSDDYELLLLCWQPGQITPIHCHGGQECWVYLVEGEIEEKRYHFNEETAEISFKDKMYLNEAHFSYMNDDMGLHSLKNISDKRAMTLHLYMNPIDECRIVNDDTGEIDLKTIEYHSIKGKSLTEDIYK
jgi:cysteine dioxygenase